MCRSRCATPNNLRSDREIEAHDPVLKEADACTSLISATTHPRAKNRKVRVRWVNCRDWLASIIDISQDATNIEAHGASGHSPARRTHHHGLLYVNCTWRWSQPMALLTSTA